MELMHAGVNRLRVIDAVARQGSVTAHAGRGARPRSSIASMPLARNSPPTWTDLLHSSCEVSPQGRPLRLYEHRALGTPAVDVERDPDDSRRQRCTYV